MKSVLKWLAAGVASLLVVVAALYFGTRGDYPVPALVTHDNVLPKQDVLGIALHMETIEGPEGAQTIIVLHGGPGADFQSLRALAALSDTHRIVFYDQRGAGLSERVAANQLTLDGYLAELDAVVDLVSSDRPVVLIGHSWGAMLATAYLGQSPMRVRRAVLIEPGYIDADGRAEWRAQSKHFMSGAGYVTQAVLTGFRAAHVTGPDKWAADDFLIGRMVGMFVRHPENPYHCGSGYTAPGWRFGAAASSAWQGVPDTEVDRIAAGTAYEGPVLLLAGACNSWTGPPLQSQHATLFANAVLSVIPNAGHDVVWDKPESTIMAIRGFLAPDA
ncbi:MAG: alpha/beta fold hydrolase [Pseudomonadota bacterium]